MIDRECLGFDLTLCPDVKRDQMSCPPRCDESAGYEHAACASLGIDPPPSQAWAEDILVGRVSDRLYELQAAREASRCPTIRLLDWGRCT